MRVFILLALLGLLGGCASLPQPDRASSGDEIQRVAKIMQHYQAWEGVPHRLGGNDQSGIDCSGYTRRLYQELFNISLDRRAADQRKQGERISKRKVEAGDLVFFAPSSYPDHVGIALGKDRFVHVSAKRGVVISSFKEPYWNKRLIEARRVLN